MGHAGALIPSDVYQRLEAEEVNAIRVIDQTLASLEEARPLDISAELDFLGTLDWEELDDEAWHRLAVMFVEKVTAVKGPARGQPVITVDWTDAADTIRAAAQVLETVDA